MRSRPSTVSLFSASSNTTKLHAQSFYIIQNVVIRKWAESTLWRLKWQPFRSSPKPKIHQISFVHIHKTMWGNPSWAAGYFPQTKIKLCFDLCFLWQGEQVDIIVLHSYLIFQQASRGPAKEQGRWEAFPRESLVHLLFSADHLYSFPRESYKLLLCSADPL